MKKDFLQNDLKRAFVSSRFFSFCLPTIHLILIFFLLGVPLSVEASSRQDLILSLRAMGYRNITIDGCRVSFSRFFASPIGGAGFYRYDRSFRLDKLKTERATPVKKIISTSGTYYSLTFPATSIGDRDYLEVIKFKVWVHKNFPGTVWPVHDPQRQSTITSAIQKVFEKNVSTHNLNYWIYYTRFGKSTIVERDFSLTFSAPTPLRAFRDAVVALSNEALGCNN